LYATENILKLSYVAATISASHFALTSNVSFLGSRLVAILLRLLISGGRGEVLFDRFY
jgi:hypothetical protein